MLARLRESAYHWWGKFWPAARQAVAASYGWKPPIERIPGGYASPVLYLLAGLFLILRLFWPLQLLKVFVRFRAGSRKSIHPAWAEAYTLGSLCIGVISIWSTADGIRLFCPPPWLIWVAALWKVADTVTNNLYYLLLRPIFDQTPPHSTYRSLVLALFGLLECWVWLSIAWYYVGTTIKPFESIVAALYFTTQFLFTGGDGGYSPSGANSHLLAIFTTFTAIGMLVVVLGRAIGIVRPPPSIAPASPAASSSGSER